jgi:hypothetical protein
VQEEQDASEGVLGSGVHLASAAWRTVHNLNTYVTGGNGHTVVATSAIGNNNL